MTRENRIGVKHALTLIKPTTSKIVFETLRKVICMEAPKQANM